MTQDRSQTIDGYIKAYPADVQRKLREMRKTIRKAAPEAAEIISYGVPTFKLNGKNLVHFAAFKKHISFFPTSSGVRAFEKELSTFKLAKGTVRFPLHRPIPYGLVKRITEFRVKQFLNNSEAVGPQNTRVVIEADVAIRGANIGDAAPIAKLMSQLGYETAASDMRSRLQLLLGNSNYVTMVAVAEKRVCGMIGTVSYPSYEHNDPAGYIIALIVTTDMRGSGIGRKLVAAAEREFARRRISRIAVNTRMTRLEAHKFYEALGFQRNGYRFVKKIA